MDPLLWNWMATKPDVMGVGYHASFPYAGDPFYLANPEEQNARGFYYEVNRTPAMFIDGPPQIGGYTVATFEARYNLRKSIPSPARIEMERTYNPGPRTGQALVRVIAEQPIPGDLRLRMAVIENHVPYDAQNGISIHEYVFRKFMPDTTGTILAFAPPYPDSATVSLPFAIATDWAVWNCEIVAFVQEQGSRELHQGGKVSVLEPGTGVSDPAGAAISPRILAIEPNPFSDVARIRFEVAPGSALRLLVHDVHGRTIRELSPATMTSNAQEMRWDGRDALGREVGSGVYFFRLSDSGSGVASPVEKALRVR